MTPKLRVIPVGLLLAVSIAPMTAYGQVPEVLFSAPEERTLTVVELLQMTVRAYEPTYVLSPARRAAASYKTPESALEGWLGAIVAGDREWLAGSFDQASRPSVSAEAGVEERFFDYYFRGRRVELLHRLEVDGRLLIELASYDRESGERLFKNLMHLRQEQGSWRLAELPVTPVFGRLGTDFDPEATGLTIDLGHVMRTIRP